MDETPLLLSDITSGDLLYAKKAITIWHEIDEESGDVVGHENCVKKVWLTVMETKLIDEQHFTKVWLHTPIWGSYSHTMRYIGWVWTAHASERLSLHKIDSVL